MEEYQDESSISEQFYILKPLVKPDKEEHDANSLSTECRITPESFSAISINETMQQNVIFDSFKEEHFEDDNCNRGFEPEMIKAKPIPTVGATIDTTVKEPIENPVISSLLKTSPSTFAPFHVPNFERESLKSRSSKLSEEDSKVSLTDDGLQKAKAALKTIQQQKVASVPLRKADVAHQPSFLTICDRARKKDWDGRFWCADNRSRVLSFMISEERKF
ncbi:unnamed protein product [Hymenolepis diminuta]|uniref:Uncharacterized protein n=1 Tax=Hymenolepis diminuta TaxID=6216 RepID=A0A564Z303_HYMDI|nr:unnamed protein product [Hymenolepis diminuta]